jgi:hypothetical protein
MKYKIKLDKGYTMNPATDPNISSFVKLLKNNNELADAIEKIRVLELPCYSCIGDNRDDGESECDEENLCDACKVREILNGL